MCLFLKEATYDKHNLDVQPQRAVITAFNVHFIM